MLTKFQACRWYTDWTHDWVPNDLMLASSPGVAKKGIIFTGIFVLGVALGSMILANEKNSFDNVI